MKKINLLILVLLLSCHFTVNARGTNHLSMSSDQVNKEFRVSDYTAVSVSSGIDVVLTDDVKGMVRVEFDAPNPVAPTISVSGETLMIYFKSSARGRRDVGSIKVYVPVSGVNKLTASGGSDIVSDVVIAVPQLRINLSGSSDMTAKVKCGRVVAEVSGSADMKLTGVADLLELSASGSSDVYCQELIADRVVFAVSGSSDASVSANEEISGSASGGSSVYYSGDPKISNIRVSGGADVVKKIR